jgi:hypothetical protein
LKYLLAIFKIDFNAFAYLILGLSFELELFTCFLLGLVSFVLTCLGLWDIIYHYFDFVLKVALFNVVINEINII